MSSNKRLLDDETRNRVMLGNVIVTLRRQQGFQNIFACNIVSGNCFGQQCFLVYGRLHACVEYLTFVWKPLCLCGNPYVCVEILVCVETLVCVKTFVCVETLVNPRHACAARVTVVVLCVCMCVCVSTHTCRLTHWNHKREIPTDSAQYRDRFKFCRFS